MYATRGNRREVLRLLLQVPHISVDSQNNRGYTALMDAAKDGKEDMVRLLLEHGAQVHVQNMDGESLLLLV